MMLLVLLLELLLILREQNKTKQTKLTEYIFAGHLSARAVVAHALMTHGLQDLLK